MSQNGQTHFKNLAAFVVRFLKCVWQFWDIIFQNQNQVSKTEIAKVKKLLNDIVKAVVIDTILSQLIKISFDIISEPLAIVINNCLTQSIFPQNAKIAFITPLEGEPNKHEISN